ncbi:uncharacterized protein LOC122498627 [Leptopilina heterotoma]|uniref:uncharacterized protein LOC122498627 n=1 Tax=Leptopilina heterotoma TaxID=63436 RepID=UPI001CA8C34C|nr:uncharacterized protein LOC122498627 [Leptopilina heterotoma]
MKKFTIAFTTEPEVGRSTENFGLSKDRLPLVKNWEMNVYLFSRRDCFSKSKENFSTYKKKEIPLLYLDTFSSLSASKERSTISSLLERRDSNFQLLSLSSSSESFQWQETFMSIDRNNYSH